LVNECTLVPVSIHNPGALVLDSGDYGAIILGSLMVARLASG